MQIGRVGYNRGVVTRGANLILDTFSMSIGEMSVGLPSACSVDTLLVTYLELVGKMRPERIQDLRQADLEALSAGTGLDVTRIKNHLTRLSANTAV